MAEHPHQRLVFYYQGKEIVLRADEQGGVHLYVDGEHVTNAICSPYAASPQSWRDVYADLHMPPDLMPSYKVITDPFLTRVSDHLNICEDFNNAFVKVSHQCGLAAAEHPGKELHGQTTLPTPSLREEKGRGRWHP